MREGWKEVRLEEVCRLRNGRAYKKMELLNAGKYPVLRVGNFFTNNHWYYSDLELDDTKYCNPGDLLYAWSASFGPRIWEGEKSIYHYHIWRVDFDEDEVLKEFLYYWFNWDAERIKEAHGAGTTMVHVSMASMKARHMALPPLSEQKRIVEILDEAFAAIERARANTEKNLANAREVFEGYWRELLEISVSDWDSKPLGDICENLDSRRIPITKSKRNPGNIPYYGASGIVDYVADYLFDESLLLVSEDGANLLARTYLIAFSISGKTWVNNHAHVLRFKNAAHQKFVEYYMNSIDLAHYVSGMAQPKLNQKALNSIPVPWSEDLIKVGKVVRAIETTEVKTKLLSNIYQQKLALLAELKQSLLHKAFTGALTADFDAVDRALEEAGV